MDVAGGASSSSRQAACQVTKNNDLSKVVGQFVEANRAPKPSEKEFWGVEIISPHNWEPIRRRLRRRSNVMG